MVVDVKEGGLQALTCARCGNPINDGDSTEQNPDSTRSHQLQQCFDLVQGDRVAVNETLSKTAKTDEKTIKELTKQVAELQDQIEARDDELTRAAKELEDLNEVAGKMKPKK